MEVLYKLLSDAQASLFILFHKTWVYHWNVTGPDFYQVHKLLNDQYDAMFEEIDRISEHMRYLNVKPLSSMKRMLEVSKVSEGSSSLDKEGMINDLLKSNQTLCDLFAKISDEAETQKSHATSNLVDDLMESHGKFVWMLRATLENKPQKVKEEVLEPEEELIEEIQEVEAQEEIETEIE
jgi:starvation-inducible DNA-binding protein